MRLSLLGLVLLASPAFAAEPPKLKVLFLGDSAGHQPASRFIADFVGEGVFLPATVIDGVHLDSELGVLQLSAPTLRAAGDKIDLLLRPDDVVHDDASPNTAKVIARAFRGAEFLYTLELPSGRSVLAVVPSHHNHRIGEAIGIRVELDHVVAF